MNYGYDYKTADERAFILLLIQGAVARQETYEEINEQIERFIRQQGAETSWDMEQLQKDAAHNLSDELLYMKFLQGIPVVGVIGGAYDAVCMRQISVYAELKYRKRFYLDRRE